MALLYGNENFPLPVVEELRRLGHDVLTVQETGRAEQSWPDEQVLAFAVGEGRAVLTLNRIHFRRLHLQLSQHAGIILCTYDPAFAEQTARIHAAIAGQPSLAGKLLQVYRPAR
jgi:hypothetical protein